MSFKRISLLILALSIQVARPAAREAYRDSSWPTGTQLCSDSFFTLVNEQAFADKITLLEEKLTSDSNFFFGFFSSIIPIKWNPGLKSASVWNYDALDALYIGINNGYSNIVQAALNMLPTSKALIDNGRTTDFRDKNIVIDGKVKIDQYIALNTRALETKLNRYRVNKVFMLPIAAATYLGAAKASFIAKTLLPNQIEPASEILKSFEGKTKYALTALPVISGLLMHYLQNLKTEEHVKSFEILLKSDKVTFDKETTKSSLRKLQRKLTSFGFGKKFANRLRALEEQL